MARMALAVVFLAFSAFSGYVAIESGYMSVIWDPFERLTTTQVFFDLAISLGLISIWMILDWKKRGRPMHRLVPFLLGTVLFGSLSPLLYLLMRDGADKEGLPPPG